CSAAAPSATLIAIMSHLTPSVIAALLVSSLAASAEEIPAGAQIRPPKKSGSVANLEAERAWFERLHTVTVADLRPGDVLLRKYYRGIDNTVVMAQSFHSGSHGTTYTTN